MVLFENLETSKKKSPFSHRKDLDLNSSIVASGPSPTVVTATDTDTFSSAARIDFVTFGHHHQDREELLPPWERVRKESRQRKKRKRRRDDGEERRASSSPLSVAGGRRLRMDGAPWVGMERKERTSGRTDRGSSPSSSARDWSTRKRLKEGWAKMMRKHLERGAPILQERRRKREDCPSKEGGGGCGGGGGGGGGDDDDDDEVVELPQERKVFEVIDISKEPDEPDSKARKGGEEEDQEEEEERASGRGAEDGRIKIKTKKAENKRLWPRTEDRRSEFGEVERATTGRLEGEADSLPSGCGRRRKRSHAAEGGEEEQQNEFRPSRRPWRPDHARHGRRRDRCRDRNRPDRRRGRVEGEGGEDGPQPHKRYRFPNQCKTQ